MIYKGRFKFDGKNHPGECEVDDNNNIYITINESNINEYKKKSQELQIVIVLYYMAVD